MEQNRNNPNGGVRRSENIELLSPEQADQVSLEQLIARDALEAELRERRGNGDRRQQPPAPTEGTDSADAQTGQRRTPGEAESHRPLANVYRDPERHTVTLLLDETTANTVIYAARLMAADSEAHAREVRMVAGTLPPESYGAANRYKIAARHERVAARLRVLEGNYREVVSDEWSDDDV
jgi:hypothetical protein